MGNTVVFKPPQLRRAALRPAARGASATPSRRAWSTPSTARGATIVGAADGLRQGRRAGLHRHQPGGRPAQEAAPQAAPPALRPGPGRQEPGHRPARRRPRPGRARVRARQRCPSTASAAPRSRSSSSTRRSPTPSSSASPRRSTALKTGMPWEPGVDDHAAARAGQARLPDASWSTTPLRQRRAGRERGRRRGRRHLLPSRRCSTRSTPGCALYHEEQFGPVVPVVPFTTSRSRSATSIESELRPAGQHLRPRPGSAWPA